MGTGQFARHHVTTTSRTCSNRKQGARRIADNVRPPFRADHVGSLLRPKKDYQWAPPSAHVTAPIMLPETIVADAFTYLRDNVAPGQTAKLTIPSPSMVHYRGGRSAIDATVYPDLAQFWDDLAAAYGQEVKNLYDLGCRCLQLDDTSPADMAITTHMCRGNNQSMWAAEGGYDFIADTMFNQLDVAAEIWATRNSTSFSCRTVAWFHQREPRDRSALNNMDTRTDGKDQH